MSKSRTLGMLAGALMLVIAMLVLFGGSSALAQDNPAGLGNLALVKYVCPTDVGNTGTTIPAVCEDANDPNGSDVPVIPVGGAVSFIYKVTYTCNPGIICEPLNPISVTIIDTQLPGVTPTEYGPLTDANSNGQIDPDDVWLYKVNGLQAINLSQPGLTLPGGGPIQACTNAADGGGTRPTYVNNASVTGPTSSEQDPAAYCNPLAPTATLSSVCVNTVRTWTATATQTGTYVIEFLVNGSVSSSRNINLTANTPQTFTYEGDPTTLSAVRLVQNGTTLATENGPFQSCNAPQPPTVNISNACLNNVRTWTVTSNTTGTYTIQFVSGGTVVSTRNVNLTANTPQTFTYEGDPTTLSSVSVVYNGTTVATNNGPFAGCVTNSGTRPVQIPEPVTIVLFGTGLAALSAAVAARRRANGK